MTLIMS